MKQRIIKGRSKRLPPKPQTLKEKADMALADLYRFMGKHHPLDKSDANETDQVAGDQERVSTLAQPGMRINKIGFGKRILRSSK